MTMEDLKSCPFCGKQPDIEDDDTLYPNGIGWMDHNEIGRTYRSFRDVPKEQWCYSVHCVKIAGGCGAEISGDSAEEAVQAWNKRAPIWDTIPTLADYEDLGLYED